MAQLHVGLDAFARDGLQNRAGSSLLENATSRSRGRSAIRNWHSEIAVRFQGGTRTTC